MKEPRAKVRHLGGQYEQPLARNLGVGFSHRGVGVLPGPDSSLHDLGLARGSNVKRIVPWGPVVNADAAVGRVVVGVARGRVREVDVLNLSEIACSFVERLIKV